MLERTSTVDDDFAAVFAEQRERAVRLAWLLVGDPDQAEDVAAEAFAKTWRRWRRGGIENPGAYVRRAVVNESNSRLRRRYREADEARRATGDDRGIRLLDENAADRDEVFRALRRVPARQRAALVLRFYEDLSERDAAEVLGVSVGTVKSLTSRGLDRLHEALEVGR